MTREERKKAIKVLNDMKVKIDIPKAAKMQNDKNWALDVAIQALSQEPTVASTDEPMTMVYPTIVCEDAVSRQAVLDGLKGCICEEWIKTLFATMVKQLPSVTQKSGKWIKVKSGDKDFPESIVCSRCSNENSHLDFNENAEPIGKVFVTSKYCPNCGAKMESEDKE